jgi:phospho-N-acetylmuramoyl-pentapeptide-transferase
MIFFLQDLLQFLGMHLPSAFLNTSTRAIVAGITSFAFCLLLGPFFIRKLYELKIGQPIRELSGFKLSELHKNKKDTPTMGGILILAAMLVSLFLWMDLTSAFTWILCISTLAFGAVGGYDDYLKLRHKNHKGLSARKKLLVQLAAALVVIGYMQLPFFNSPQIIDPASNAHLTLQEYSSRLYIPFFKEPLVIFSGVGLILLWGFLTFVIVGSSNAVNLTDGLDGLAGGLVLMVSATLGIFAFVTNHQEIASYLNILYVEGSGEIAIYLAAMCGACLGFLWFNCSPAQLFMGDIGSLTLGGLLGVAAVLLKREFLLGLVGFIFVLEALSVILQVASYKLRDKKRIFLCAPLHHHFEYKGWPETKVVVRFWIVGLMLALLGLLTLKVQ